jgi:hypothetical protein
MSRSPNRALGLNFNKNESAQLCDDQKDSQVVNNGSSSACFITPHLVDESIKIEGTLKWNDCENSKEIEDSVVLDGSLFENIDDTGLTIKHNSEPLFSYNQEVYYTMIPARGWHPTDKNDKGYVKTIIVDIHKNESENTYTLQGTEKTNYEPVEVTENKLIIMQDTVDYLKKVYKKRNETALTCIMGAWPKMIKALCAKRTRTTLESEESHPHGSSAKLDIIERQNKINAIKKALGVATVAIGAHELADGDDRGTNLSEYKYPWHWAYEHWGDNASQSIRDLANIALNEGYDVEWHEDNTWLSINGDSTAKYVISVLSQYANSI